MRPTAAPARDGRLVVRTISQKTGNELILMPILHETEAGNLRAVRIEVLPPRA